MENVHILSNSIFENIESDANGSHLLWESSTVQIFCCFFIENYAKQFGGSLYCTDSVTSVSKSLFYRCCSLAKTQDVWGNAIYQNGSSLNIEKTEISQCSYSDTKCSDSSMMIHNALGEINTYNGSFNHGFQGGSGFAFYNAKDGSKAKYSNLCGGVDHDMLETSFTSIDVIMTNIINCSHSTCIVAQSTNDLFKFNSCVFWDTGNILFSFSGLSFKAVNCISDRAFGSLTQTIDIEIIELKIAPVCIVTKTNRSTWIRRLKILVYHVMMIKE